MCQLLNFTPCPSFGSNFTVCDIFKCLERIWNEWTKPLLYVLYTLSNIVDVLNRLSCAKLMVKSTTITIKNYVITAIKHKNLKGSNSTYISILKLYYLSYICFSSMKYSKFSLYPKETPEQSKEFTLIINFKQKGASFPHYIHYIRLSCCTEHQQDTFHAFFKCHVFSVAKTHQFAHVYRVYMEICSWQGKNEPREPC